jgi:hypothetical protein
MTFEAGSTNSIRLLLFYAAKQQSIICHGRTRIFTDGEDVAKSILPDLRHPWFLFRFVSEKQEVAGEQCRRLLAGVTGSDL